MANELKWYGNADNPPWIKALAEVRHRATREGYYYYHIQAIIVAIDQYAEAALGNRDYFLNSPTASAERNDRSSRRSHSRMKSRMEKPDI